MADSVKVVGWAARDTSGILSPYDFSRNVGDHDVQFKVLYCGICHSDLHSVRNDWGFSSYPLVPGHEIVGEVTKVGSKVQKFKVGDKVGVGCMVDSCGNCTQCSDNLENYCPGVVFTYNGVLSDGSPTQGGYSNIMVSKEEFVIRWPENFPMDKGAPLLCAGITLYSPLKYYGLDKPGMNVGIVGLGGLGHVGVKFAKALGLKVTVISTTASKREEALKRIGADAFIVSRNPEEMQAAAGTLDGIIDTVSAVHPIAPLLGLVKPHGIMILVGAPDKPLELPSFSLIPTRRRIAGSQIGGIKETQEMIDFAAKHNILPEVEMVKMDYVNEAILRLEKGDVRYRFVIDIANSFQA